MLQRKAFTGASTSVGSWPPKCYSDPRTSRQSANCPTQSSKSNRDQMIQYYYLNTSMFSKTDLKSLVFRLFHIFYMFCFKFQLCFICFICFFQDIFVLYYFQVQLNSGSAPRSAIGIPALRLQTGKRWQLLRKVTEPRNWERNFEKWVDLGYVGLSFLFVWFFLFG